MAQGTTTPEHSDSGRIGGLNRSLARRTEVATRPVRRLVNAPYPLTAAIFVIWVCCSMAYAVVERKGPLESLWWGIVTGSTVGYGDYYPSTTAGRGIAAALIVSMIVLVPIAVGHVIANLVLDRNQFTHEEQVALATTVESLYDRIGVLEGLIAADLEERLGREWVEERVRRHQHALDDGTGVDDKMLDLFGRSVE